MTLKLYTDWSDLQFELKKCFRSEESGDVKKDVNYSSLETKKARTPRPESSDHSDKDPSFSYPLPMAKLKKSEHTMSLLDVHAPASPSSERSPESSSKSENEMELEQRIMDFYHWRGGLLVFINKFATILAPEQTLYFGVSRKMILAPSPTHQFFGPLSTSLSYYVARNFASETGMILRISSQYPRLGMCNAFNASLMSEYPEEQEYLVGHCYLRVREIHIKQPPEYIHIDSKLRLAFFAVHLFQRQMFSVDAHLVQYLAAFVKIHLFDVENISTTDTQRKESKKRRPSTTLENMELISNQRPCSFYQYLLKVLDPTKRANAVPPGVIKMSNEERIRKNDIFYILIKKFKEFCEFPNQRQIVKIDCVSEDLKQYFLDKDTKAAVPSTVSTSTNGTDEKRDDEQGVVQWNVSFKKLSFLFPNLKQVHFLNLYRFDNMALDRLVKWSEDPRCKLEQIKFIYIDYAGDLDDYQHYFDHNQLNKKQMEKLEKLKWKVSKQKGTGFVMKLQRS